MENVQPTPATPATPILKDGSKNRPLYSKYSLDLQLVHVVNTHRPKHTHPHTTMYMCFESDSAYHSFVLLRMENNNNNKSVITPKRCLDTCCLCLSAPWLVSDLISAVQEDGQRLLFLQVTVAPGGARVRQASCPHVHP